MKTHLYILLLAASISAAPQVINVAELLTLLQQMVAEDLQVNSIPIFLNLRIETPDNLYDVNCISTIFEGIEQLKINPAMKKYADFFQIFERLKQFLSPSLAKEEECETERRNATIFIEKLKTFIRKSLKPTR
ncbi:IL5 protein, partial [Pitta sordida]|nr:IL5 protein [Pitta sordida]